MSDITQKVTDSVIIRAAVRFFVEEFDFDEYLIENYVSEDCPELVDASKEDVDAFMDMVRAYKDRIGA